MLENTLVVNIIVAICYHDIKSLSYQKCCALFKKKGKEIFLWLLGITSILLKMVLKPERYSNTSYFVFYWK